MINDLKNLVYTLDKLDGSCYNLNKEKLKQGDIRNLEIHVFEDGEELNLENYNCLVKWVNANGTLNPLVGENVSTSGNVVYAELNDNCTKSAGTAKWELVINKGTKVDFSYTREVEILPSVEMLDGTSENLIDIWEQTTKAEQIATDFIKKYGSLDGLKGRVDELYNTKAEQRDLDAANARIDSFTHLAEGSTTGDAELIDGRVMADGIVANTIGDAIRTQINKNDKKINDFTDATISYLMPFKKLSGEYYDRNNHNISNYATSYLIDLNYYNGASVKISTSVPKGINYVTFLNSNNEVISYKRNDTQSTVTFTDTLVNIPNGAKYLVVGGLFDNNPRLYVKGEASKLKDIVKEIEFFEESELNNEESFQLILDCLQGNLGDDHKPNYYVENSFNRLCVQIPKIKKDILLTAKDGYSFTINGNWSKKALLTQKDLPMWISIKKDTNENIKQGDTSKFVTIEIVNDYKKTPKKEDGLVNITDEFIFENKAYATDGTTGQLVYKTSYDDKIIDLLAHKNFEKDCSIYVEADEGYKIYVDEFILEDDKYYRKFKYPSAKYPFKSWISSGYFNLYSDRTYFITIRKDDDSPTPPSRIPVCIYRVDNKTHIPSYYQQYVDTKIDTINNLQKGFDKFSFTFITDIHIQHNAKHCFPLIKKINRQCAISDTLGCGDWATAWLSDAEGIEGLKKDFHELKDLFDGIPLIKSIGNHDWAYGGSNQWNITNGDAYNSYYRDCACNNISFGGNGTYFYKDDLINKVRYISINVMDYEGSTTPDNANNKEFIFRVSEDQKNWLKREALNMPSDEWCCVIFSHLLPWTSTEFPFTNMGTLVENGGELETLCNQFISKSGDFSDYKGTLICWVGGHEHNDAIVKNGNLNMVCVNGDCIIQAKNAPTRTLNTITEQAFDVFTIDKTTKSVHITRIGAGTDRTFNYM